MPLHSYQICVSIVSKLKKKDTDQMALDEVRNQLKEKHQQIALLTTKYQQLQVQILFIFFLRYRQTLQYLVQFEGG